MAATMASAAGSVSPSTSPRLPSPPPYPEVQIGPKSPTGGMLTVNAAQEEKEAAKLENGSTRRIRPGTRAADMASGPPLVPLSDLDSPFQLQEHLKALYYHHTKSDRNDAIVPISHETAIVLAAPPDNVDRPLWLYELCRFLVQKANNLIVAFFEDQPPCSAQTCPEMRASEWQYLCAVHDPPKSCCAIDYCCHTLDWAANILTSQKHFPSRLTLGSEAAGGSTQGVKQLTNIFRRVYRIFAHAWFQHRQIFWQVEGHEGLYVLFKTVCDAYSLIPEDNYTIPPEASGTGVEEKSEDRVPRDEMERIIFEETPKIGSSEEESVDDGNTTTTLTSGATTRRHKHTPSTGSFTTIVEGDEEDASPDHASRTKTKVIPSAPDYSPTKMSNALPEQPRSPLKEKQASESEQTVPEPNVRDPTLGEGSDREDLSNAGSSKMTEHPNSPTKSGANVSTNE